MSLLPSPRRRHGPRAAPVALAMLAGMMGAAFPGAARAWGNLLLLDPPPAQTSVALGASVFSLPRAPGAAGQRSLLLPGLDVYSPAGWFVSTDNGVGWNLSSRKDLQAGLRLWPQFGRTASRSPAGVRPVGDRLQTEAFLNWAPLPVLLLQSGLLHGAGRQHDGTLFEMGATSGLPIGKDLLGIGLSATWANAAWRNSYFGVSPAEAQAALLPPWHLNAGWQDAALTLSAEHRFDAHWRISGQWARARLLGAAAHSPLTQARWQGGFTVSAWHDF